MAAEGLHISISAEQIATYGGLEITNSMLTSLLVSALLILFAIIVKQQLKQTQKPTGLQNFAEWLVETFHNFIHSVTGDLKKTRIFLPLVTTFFVWIIINNWLGLLPGVGTITITEHATKIPIFRAGTADLNTTLALALISVFVTQVYGVQFQSLGYFKKFINFSNPLMFFVGILEIISEVAKIISFAFRLFGNIFAGEVLLVVMTFLVPLVIPMPFYGLELFVGFIQAFIFAVLSLVFFKMATQSHEAH